MASNFESSLQRGCDFIHDFACSPCEEDGLNAKAQHFCNQCTKYYCDNCVPVHNKLYKRHGVLDRKDVKKWATAPGTVGALERCEMHPGKAVELVCVDHDQLCCHVCVAVNHRQCSSIQHIPDVAKGIREDPMFTQLPPKVADLRKQIESMEDARKKNGAALSKTRAVIVDEIRTLRKQINDTLDRMEKTTVQELDDLIAKQEMAIQKDIDFCTQINEDMKSLIDAIENKKNSGEPALYIGSKKCEDKLKEAGEVVHRMSAVETYNITYQPDKAIEEFFSSVHRFGVSTESVSVVAFKPEHVFKSLGFKEYNVRMSSDKDACDIYGVCELSSGDIVITDQANCKVKLLDQEYRVVDHCAVPENLWDVCHIGGYEFAVCMDNSDNGCELRFMYVTKGKMVVRRKLIFNHGCYAAAHHGGQLYISTGNELCVYTMSGQLVKKLYEDTTAWETVRASAISNDGKRIYFTNPSYGELIKLDKMGNTLAKLRDPDMRDPQGVHVTSGGHVFVCGSKTVLQVDKDGKTKLTTLGKKEDGGYCPRVLFFSGRISSLVVGGQKDTLLVIRLQ